MFVLKNKLTGKFLVGRYGGETDDLQKARTFSRKCDASNAIPYRYGSIKKEDCEVVPVMLVLCPDEPSPPVVAPDEPHPFPIFQPQACVGD